MTAIRSRRLCVRGGCAWITVFGALAISVLAACSSGPDLVREERQADESHSPADQYRILGSGKFLNSDYFIERGTQQGGIALLGGEDKTKKAEELDVRVQRLEQQAKGEETTQPSTPTVKTAPKAIVEPAVTGTNAEQIKTRLRLLTDLKKEGLITEQEFQEKRQEILKGL